MQPTYEKQSKTKLTATIVAVIVIAGIIILADHLKSSDNDAAPLTTTSASSGTALNSATSTGTSAGNSSSGSTSTTASSSAGYKDGTYSASSSYYVPHGYEQIQVSLTVKSGVITASSITNSESDPESARFQENFASSYKSYVVGQKLSSLQLGVISGASDTTQGFNDALSKIASEAQA